MRKKKNHKSEVDSRVPSDSGGRCPSPREGAAGNGEDEVGRDPGGNRDVPLKGQRRGSRGDFLIPGTEASFSVTKVAKLLDTSRSFIYSLIADGKLRGRQLAPRMTRILRHDLEDFLRDCDILGGRAA